MYDAAIIHDTSAVACIMDTDPFCFICVHAHWVMIDGEMMAAKLHSGGVQLDPYTVPGLEQV
jgi:hypothetical protein